jgi:hypothetical protein
VQAKKILHPTQGPRTSESTVNDQVYLQGPVKLNKLNVEQYMQRQALVKETAHNNHMN